MASECGVARRPNTHGEAETLTITAALQLYDTDLVTWRNMATRLEVRQATIGKQEGDLTDKVLLLFSAAKLIRYNLAKLIQ